MELKVYDMKAKEVGKIDLNNDVFAQEYNEPLIHQVVVAQLANKRQGTKSTLTRAEVRGGGAKPWRQKGTGRARQGSIRSPQWIKGGVVFAPKPRDFSQKINKKMKDIALKSALSAKITDGNFTVLKELAIKQAKTKEVQSVLDSFKVKGKVLVVVDNYSEDILRASRNIPNITLTTAEMINVYDLVANAKCIITEGAVKKLEEVYA